MLAPRKRRLPGERRQIRGHHPPSQISPGGPVRSPLRHRPTRHRIGHLGHGCGDAFGLQRGDGGIGNAAGHDAGESFIHLASDVEGKPMQRAAPIQLHPYGGNLAGRRAMDVEPHASLSGASSGPGQTQISKGIDDDLLNATDIGRSVGHPAIATTPSGNREDGVAHQLTRPVVSEVSTPIDVDHFGSHRGWIHQQMFGFGPNPLGVRGWMLQQQQVIGRSGVERPLQRMGVVVRHSSQPTNMERATHDGYSSLDQSRVSRSCFTKPRNDAA